MSDHVLILNKNWVAFAVTTSFSALVSMCRERANAMCPDTYELYNMDSWIDRSIQKADQLSSKQTVRTVSIAIEKPEIIIAKEYGGIPFKQVNLTRRNIYRRDQYMCQYCQGAFTTQKLTIDHVIPTSRGGTNSWNNCVTSCEPCNAKKSNRTPQECGMKLIKRPKMPKWTPISGMIPASRPKSWGKFLKI